MPRLSCWFIRASLIYLATGFTMGGLLLFHKGIAVQPLFWQMLPPHIEFLLLGWTLQLAMGVAFWILPRDLQGTGRGNTALAWLAFGLINAGVLLAGVGWMMGASSFLIFLGRLAEAGGAIAFVMHAWPRVKPLLPR
jgi:heme/copper-type cytochrome/quinol oxidase subunit 1